MTQAVRIRLSNVCFLSHSDHHSQHPLYLWLLRLWALFHYAGHSPLALSDRRRQLSEGLAGVWVLKLSCGFQSCSKLLLNPGHSFIVNGLALPSQGHDLVDPFLSQGTVEVGLGFGHDGQSQAGLLGSQFETIQRLSWQAVGHCL